MPSKRYALEPRGPERLEVSWQGLWKGFTVRVDGRSLGSLADKKELRRGRDFPLEDGSTLRVQLVQVLLTPELRISRNGEPLPGSAADPEQRLAVAYGVIFFVAGGSVLLGLLAAGLHLEFLQRLGAGGVFDPLGRRVRGPRIFRATPLAAGPRPGDRASSSSMGLSF